MLVGTLAAVSAQVVIRWTAERGSHVSGSQQHDVCLSLSLFSHFSRFSSARNRQLYKHTLHTCYLFCLQPSIIRPAMASPRIQVPSSGQGSTGNPILDSANAVDPESTVPITLEGNRPAQSSPLKSSTVAADLEGQDAASSSSSNAATGDQQQQTQGQPAGVESVITAIGGAAVWVSA